MKLLDLSGLVIGKRFYKHRRHLRPVRPSRANELWYKAELLKLVRYTNWLLKQYAPYQSQILRGNSGRDLMTVLDSWRPDIEQWISDVSSHMGGLQMQAERLAEMATDKSILSVDQRLTQTIKDYIGVDIRPYLNKSGPIKQRMDIAKQENVDLIKSIPAQHLSKVKQAVIENFEAGLRWEELVPVIEHIGIVTENRAKLIARDQISKMNGSFNSVRQQTLGIESYVWETAGDERVRDSHAAHDGKIFRWDDPPEDTGHPGEDINCRCVALPHFDLSEVDSYAD